MGNMEKVQTSGAVPPLLFMIYSDIIIMYIK